MQLKKAPWLGIFREEIVNKYMLIIAWCTVAAVTFAVYINGSSPTYLMQLLVPGAILLIPTLLYILLKRSAAIKYIFACCVIVYIYLLLYIQEGDFDNTFFLFVVLASTAVYFNTRLTIITTLFVLIITSVFYMIDAKYFFPAFTLLNFMVLITSLGAVGAVIAMQTRMGKKLLNSQLELYNRATKDRLTDTYNRAFFDEYLASVVMDCTTQKRSLTLLVFDVDFFKSINDTYGHPEGDTVLRKIGGSLTSVCRKQDIVARIGGDEFGMILFDTRMNEAHGIAQRCRETILQAFHDVDIKAMASYGMAEANANDTPETLFKRADDALYIAKRNKLAVLGSKHALRITL